LSINNENVKARTLADFVLYAKANQGKLNFAATSATVRLTQETFNKLAGLQMIGIEYKGNSQASTALLANEVQSYFGTVGGAAANMATGKVIVLGVADDRRMPGLPNVPTMTEMGYPVRAYLTGAVYAPAGVPRSVITILEPIVREAVATPEMEKVLLQQRGRALTVSRDDYAKVLREEINFWREAAKANNYQAQ
jgi:tripartite-type tricarboxylate transporter receptor subunit TctC